MNTPVTEETKYLIKLKGAGFTDATIAKKLGIPEAEVVRQWKELEAAFLSGSLSGFAAFCDHVTVTAHQYQLLGESLKIMAEVLSNPVSEKELREMVVADIDQTIKNLQSRCIMLRPFIPVTPEESIRRTTKNN